MEYLKYSYCGFNYQYEEADEEMSLKEQSEYFSF